MSDVEIYPATQNIVDTIWERWSDEQKKEILSREPLRWGMVKNLNPQEKSRLLNIMLEKL